MRVPIEWLKSYVGIEKIDEKTLMDKLVLTGSNNEGSYKICEGVENVVVGKILNITQHPNADKLVVVTVDVGTEEIQIVTGATNINIGDYIPVALNGATIARGVKIKKGKLRGEVSNGMLCSLEELGFEGSSIPKEFDDGILILDQPYPVGEDILKILKLDNSVIEFEITPNRPDCLSMLGMAREVSASFDIPVNLPEVYTESAASEVKSFASVRIDDSDLCPRYAAKIIKNIKIESSPQWMQLRLMQSGMRPINNIVDITNYVMLEYGQPIHAFDLHSVSGGEIIIRRAVEGEVITTLDDKDRVLSQDMLVIADKDKPIAIAGVMGGANTEISVETKAVLLEVATFDKTSIRKTSKDLGLRSEASSRYEKGVSVELPAMVVDRVCHLIELLDAGEVVPGLIDVYPNKAPRLEIPFRVERINQMIGCELTIDEMIAIFKKLEIGVVDTDGYKAIPPYYRLDLLKEIDLVEEIARLYGYDQIKMTLPKTSTWGARTNAQLIEEKAKTELLASGVDEILTYSFVSRKDLDRIHLPEDSLLRKQVELINPLGEEFSVMRASLVPNILEVLSRNYNRKNLKVKVFEMGSVFLPKELPVMQLPIEKKMLTIGIYGEHEDFFTLKGIVENLLTGIGIDGYYFEKETHAPSYHTGRCANIIWGDHILGTMGEIHPLVQEEYSLGTRTYVADLDFNLIMQLSRESKLFKSIPRYPAIERDIAVLVKDETTSLQIEQLVKSSAGELLESVVMFDMYKGRQIPEGYKSAAYALVFRSEERTLEDEAVNKIFSKILKALEVELDAQLR
ncbi:MAG: phenylalanine--tRNA ligase subunit beta [Clostridia bacterium]|nr:phenylalanine--tRNA ligase subunit beta [Clostridia bacterium]